MPFVYDYKKEDLGKLLAASVLDASGEITKNAGLEVSDQNRTIIIGLGGTGVRTADYIKGELKKRLAPDWVDYVGFLGLDASWSELEGAIHLDEKEKLMYTLPGVVARMSNPAGYPAAARRFMPKAVASGQVPLAALDMDGAGRTRLLGKIKIHDQSAGNKGADEQIVNKIANIKASLTALPPGPGKYEVYVIGSVAGGTCSGGFMEMPALIRKAIPDRVTVNGILYLPDALTNLDPEHAEELKSNGYATLKELNYFMGMYMRPGYPEIWPINDKAGDGVNPYGLRYSSTLLNEKFIDIPFLVGSLPDGANRGNLSERISIAEFIISLLTKIDVPGGGQFVTSAFLANAMAPGPIADRQYNPGSMVQEEELIGHFHEFPRRFCSIGFAQATVPEKVVRIYTLSEMCKKAGLKPVSAAKRAEIAANGVNGGTLLPFTDAEDLMNAQAGTTKALELLAPILSVFQQVDNVDFSFVRDVAKGQAVTWNAIRNNQFDGPATAAVTGAFVQQKTNSVAMDGLRSWVRQAFQSFRTNVREYVKAEGPYAFSNVCKGRFAPVGDYFGFGINDILRKLVEQKLLTADRKGYMLRNFASSSEMRSNLEAQRRTIGSTGLISFNHQQQASAWVNAQNALVKAQVVEKRAEQMFGAVGMLKKEFCEPAITLAQQVEAFGDVISALAGIYSSLGSAVEDFNSFRNAADNATEFNLAGVDHHVYDWIKDQTQTALDNANAAQLRDNLVDDFFSDPMKWLSIPNTGCVKVVPDTGEVQLVHPDVAIPARRAFDEFMGQNFPTAIDVSILSMFSKLQGQGVPFAATASKIVNGLKNMSRPMFNGDIPDTQVHSFILYPDSLNQAGGDGPAIAQALQNAAGPGVAVYATASASTIMYYQQATTLEIYRLAELKDWENVYENGAKGINAPERFLHGMSQDVKQTTVNGNVCYEEGYSWVDYPSIASSDGDPTQPDPITGMISREGRFRLEVKALAERALELGVLYFEGSEGAWSVMRVNCDRSREWKFDLMQLSANERGELPIGRNLSESVAEQNGLTLDNISRKVTLQTAGVLSKASYTTKEVAFKYAVRTLRAHMPMLIEVRETMKKYEEWAREILIYNERIARRYLPGKMLYMIMGGVIKRKESGEIIFVRENGAETMVANLSPAMRRLLPPPDKAQIENGLLGFYIFNKLDKVLKTTKDFDTAYVRAKANYMDFLDKGYVEEIEANGVLAEEFKTEIATMKAMGARLGAEDEQVSASFRDKLPAALRPKADEIQSFYYRLSLWELL